MFTGIVEERGTVASIAGSALAVRGRTALGGLAVGDSIAVNGVCLTAVAIEDGVVSFDLSDETLARSSLGRLVAGDPVNLERPLTLLARLGGHLVQGHVDAVGTIRDVVPEEGGGARLRVSIPAELLRFVVEKGSIAIDGVSLTVAALRDDGVEVALIPHTLAATTLGSVRAGDPVNVEVDVVARYVAAAVERSLADGDPAAEPGDVAGAWR
jgi:riboflavin synthase